MGEKGGPLPCEYTYEKEGPEALIQVRPAGPGLPFHYKLHRTKKRGRAATPDPSPFGEPSCPTKNPKEVELLFYRTQQGHSPDGALHLADEGLRSERTPTGNQPAHPGQKPWHGTRPGTIHTAPAIGSWQASHKAKVLPLPERQRHVFRAGAEISHLSQRISSPVDPRWRLRVVQPVLLPVVAQRLVAVVLEPRAPQGVEA
jgi:hypothetical protein